MEADGKTMTARRLFSLALIAALAGCSALPASSDGRRGTSAPTPAQDSVAVRSGNDAQCLSALSGAGARFSPLPDRYLGEGCTNLNTVQLSAVYSDTSALSVTNLGPVTCEVSQAFAAWARFGVDRAARQILGSGLRTIETMGSYSCRNVAGSSRRSAHSTGAAIDIGAFVLEDGRRISIKQGWRGGNSKEREFLRVVHASACKRFGTVLGPEYNAAHEDHLHLEGIMNGRGYCR
jgi:hypothetical protein